MVTTYVNCAFPELTIIPLDDCGNVFNIVVVGVNAVTLIIPEYTAGAPDEFLVYTFIALSSF